MRYRPRGGWLHVIWLHVFGKTEGLINRVRARIARKSSRFQGSDRLSLQDENLLVSYSGANFRHTNRWMILSKYSICQRPATMANILFVAIDEVQFLMPKLSMLFGLCCGLAVIAAGESRLSRRTVRRYADHYGLGRQSRPAIYRLSRLGLSANSASRLMALRPRLMSRWFWWKY